MGFKPVAIFVLGVSLRAGLSAHTARALTTRPVSASTPNAKFPSFLSEPEFVELIEFLELDILF